MKNKILIHSIGYLSLLILLFSACSDQLSGKEEYPQGGAILNLSAGIETETRLAELGTVDSINISFINDKEYGHKHLGLYIYYQKDYDKNDKGDLSQPYVRNMECRIDSSGKIIPVGASGEDEKIYIYDNMTIVAFYPYNPAMSLEENYFENKDDEEKYPITEVDYSEQYFIPYRGIISGVNPTNAYSARIYLYPKHTFKVEVVLISDDINDFPNNRENIKIFPELDPANNTNLTIDCKRANWIDGMEINQQTGGGSHMARYVAYIWQTDTDERKKHVIEENTLLFESEKLTLYTSDPIEFEESLAYRYGYNLTTGEVFIPTSSRIAYDAQTLQNTSCIQNSLYQACDIDLKNFLWQPKTAYNGRFDGGGHRISGLKIEGNLHQAGLFSYIKGTSTLQNINLIKPEITISNVTTDSCYVGAICARVNSPITADELNELQTGWPEELSQVVKDALLEEMMGSLVNTTSRISACRVEEPVITLNNVVKPHVGSVAGSIGETDKYGSYNAIVWDTYALGGKITVNKNNPELNLDANAQVSAFCGFNKGRITRCYTTTEDITFYYLLTTGPIGEEETHEVHKQQVFSFQGDNSVLEDCYCADETDKTINVNRFKDSWPGNNWLKYTVNKWPVYTGGWTSTNNSFWWKLGARDVAYPTLLWERK